MSIEITNLVELQAMKDNLSGDYILMNNIDASNTNPDNVDLWEDKDYTAGEWVKYDDSGTVKTYYCTDDTTSSQVPTDTDYWAEMWVSAEGFVPVGTSANRFTGSFDGQGYTIDGVFFSRAGESQCGLWGFIGSSAILQNANFVNLDFTASSQVALCGVHLGSVIRNIFVSGNFAGTSEIGGIVGRSWEAIENCEVSVSAQGSFAVGGIAGRWARRTIESCVANGEITAFIQAGGVVGRADPASGGVLGNSYSKSKITGNNAENGGLVGRVHTALTIANCYSIGQVDANAGGLVGTIDEGVTVTDTANFYDTETSGQATSAMGIGRTTAQMKDIKTYTVAGYQDNGITAGQEWDIKNVFRHRTETWKIHKRVTYPLLSFQKYVFTRIHQMLLGRNF